MTAELRSSIQNSNFIAMPGKVSLICCMPFGIGVVAQDVGLHFPFSDLYF